MSTAKKTVKSKEGDRAFVNFLTALITAVLMGVSMFVSVYSTELELAKAHVRTDLGSQTAAVSDAVTADAGIVFSE